MGYVAARIDELKTHLASLPPVDPAKRELTKLEAIRRLSGEIAGLQKKGYRIDEVAQFISEQGVSITGATLKQYLYRLKAKRGRRRGAQLGDTSPALAEELSAPAEQTETAATGGINKTIPAAAQRLTGPPADRAPNPLAVNATVNEPLEPSVSVDPLKREHLRPTPAAKVTLPARTSLPHAQPRPTAAAGAFLPREDSDDI